MLIKPYNFIFLALTFLGTMITCSASSWMSAWVGLEVNLMGFAPLLIKTLTPNYTETSIKYFLIQAMASLLIIFSAMASTLLGMNLILTSIMILSIGLKAGVAPLHFWFPQVMMSMMWMQSLILMTWQKIAPLIIMNFYTNWLTILMIISSSVVGAMGGMGQTSLKKIMAYSSIINASWLMAIGTQNLSQWWTFFIIYSTVVMSLIVYFSYSSAIHLKDMFNQNHPLLFKLGTLINVMSMAGLPPFAGFFIKIMIISTLMSNTLSLYILFALIFSSIISFYFYMRMMYSISFIFKTTSNLMQDIKKNNWWLINSMMISIFFNVFYPFLSFVN